MATTKSTTKKSTSKKSAAKRTATKKSSAAKAPAKKSTTEQTGSAGSDEPRKAAPRKRASQTNPGTGNDNRFSHVTIRSSYLAADGFHRRGGRTRAMCIARAIVGTARCKGMLDCSVYVGIN